MRILSQDNGKYDLPYENIVLEKMVDCNTIYAYTGTGQPFKMAVYSSAERMDKVMEMLREQYAKLCSLGTYIQGGMELFAKSVSQEEAENFSLEYKNMNVFQFPADDEVEV